MRELLLSAAKSHYMGLINKHISNLEVLLSNPVGISGVADKHQDIQEAIEMELGIIADYNDKLEVLQRFFIKPQTEGDAKNDKESKKN